MLPSIESSMDKIFKDIEGYQIQKSGKRTIEDKLLVHVLQQIESRKTKPMIVFTIPHEMDNIEVTDKIKKSVLRQIRSRIIDKAHLWFLAYFPSKAPHYDRGHFQQFDITNCGEAYALSEVNSNYFAIRFNSCIYNSDYTSKYPSTSIISKLVDDQRIVPSTSFDIIQNLLVTNE